MTDQTTQETTTPTPTVEGSGRTEGPLAKDDPRMVAWEAYTATPEYANAKRWAVEPAHTEGSLWAAFTSGFEASAPSPTAARGVTGLPTWEELEALLDVYVAKESAGADSDAARDDFLTTLRTLLSAAEQGERDRRELAWRRWVATTEEARRVVDDVIDGYDFTGWEKHELDAFVAELAAAIEIESNPDKAQYGRQFAFAGSEVGQPRQEGDR